MYKQFFVILYNILKYMIEIAVEIIFFYVPSTHAKNMSYVYP
jgi:hypothetical protein